MIGGDPAATVDIDIDTHLPTGKLLPFLTAARVVHCLNCDRLKYAADYIDTDTHDCIPTFDGQATA